MDPDQALKNARAALARVREAKESREVSEAADELADAFEALDGWLTSAGFAPKDWRP